MTSVDLTSRTSLQLDCARRTAPQALMFSSLLADRLGEAEPPRSSLNDTALSRVWLR